MFVFINFMLSEHIRSSESSFVIPQSPLLLFLPFGPAVDSQVHCPVLVAAPFICERRGNVIFPPQCIKWVVAASTLLQESLEIL